MILWSLISVYFDFEWTHSVTTLPLSSRPGWECSPVSLVRVRIFSPPEEELCTWSQDMSQGVSEKCDAVIHVSLFTRFRYIHKTSNNSTKHKSSTHYPFFMILVMFLNSEERRSVSVRGARGSPVWPSEKTSCELRQEPGSPGPRTREKNDNNIAHEDIYTGRDKKLVALFSVLFSPFTLIIDCCVVNKNLLSTKVTKEVLRLCNSEFLHTFHYDSWYCIDWGLRYTLQRSARHDTPCNTCNV